MPSLSLLRRNALGFAFAAVLLLGVPSVPAQAISVERVTSPGGIEAWLVRDPNIPITTIEFSFDGGAATDPAGKAGLADMTTSLLDEGAGDLDSQAFQKALDDRSVRLGFSAGFETVRGSFKTLNRHREEAVDLLRQALTQPRFDADAVVRVRSQILSELQRRASQPNFLAGRTWWRAVYDGHPYARPLDGTTASVAAISVEDMRRFVAERFARDNLYVGVVGDIEPEDLGRLLDRAFGGLPESAAPVTVDQAKYSSLGETFVVALDVPQSVVVFGHPGISRRDPDYYVARVVNYVLGGGGFSSRLYEEVREKRGLAYSVHTALNTLEHGPAVTGGVATNNQKVGESLALIRAEWARMAADGPDEDELIHAKKFLTGSFPLRLDSSNSIARMLVGMQYFDLGIDYIDRRNDYIEAVTLADARRVARRLLDPAKLAVVVVGRPEGIAATADAPDIDS